MVVVPTFDKFLNPVLEALRSLGNSGTNSEIDEKVVEILDLPEEVAEHPHLNSSTTEVAYRIAWARTYLKKAGLIENTRRGVWMLTDKGRNTDKIDPAALVQRVREMSRKPKDAGKVDPAEDSSGVTEEEEEAVAAVTGWMDRLLGILQTVHPSVFERICGLMLRESGFERVEVTGRSHDGGIDGWGILRLGGMVTFRVMFQSKRYQGTVGASAIRDFRGAIAGRAEKGIFITTGRFSREAREEAQRDGALQIDLMGGEELARHMKSLGLGVKVETVERVEVDAAWFENQ